ncbi:hypothetical protein [Dolichospermum circinale]|uniref:hypothetical protein n=1 Tax=Dolichospermum circinale TaxID=109265 RepID=UPI00232C203B|nr:hypothetical protein [Dolichospermum circinale]MDB9456298.1 hypothetical protein [Dolichospermum circinale CS-541/06]MDB9461358.1 hypothetical protein [Dolichospermum circinale CS-541/04]MDB9547021.1 hypothetical protein [Dolichospermum circinale CS-1031]
MSSTILKAKDIENAKQIIAKDLEETIRFLNRCGGFNSRNNKEKNKFDEYIKIAQGKGKSLVELKQDLLLGKKKFQKGMQMLLEITESNEAQNFFERNIQALNLLTESVIECWDFYSSDTKEFLRKFALDAAEFNRGSKNILINIASSAELQISTAGEECKIIEEVVKQHEKALQRFINSVTGAIDWKNCKTDLGRKLFKIKEKIILSGEPLLTSAEFDQYLEEETENN